jgi:hypothetical protein
VSVQGKLQRGIVIPATALSCSSGHMAERVVGYPDVGANLEDLTATAAQEAGVRLLYPPQEMT